MAARSSRLQLVEARLEQRLDGRRDRRCRRSSRRATQRPSSCAQGAAVDQHRQHLLDVQRVALGRLDDARA